MSPGFGGRFSILSNRSPDLGINPRIKPSHEISHSGFELKRSSSIKILSTLYSGVPVPDSHRFPLIQKMEVIVIITEKHECVHFKPML